MFQTNKQGMTTEIECLLLHEEAKIPQGLESLSIRIVRVSSLVMKKLSGVQSTESVEAIALMRIPSSFTDLKDDKDIITDCNKWFPSAHRVLVLDSIQDPGNLGTLVRSAMAFNWVYMISFSSQFVGNGI
jgi:TrmH family RNA methyltransferase